VRPPAARVGYQFLRLKARCVAVGLLLRFTRRYEPPSDSFRHPTAGHHNCSLRPRRTRDRAVLDPVRARSSSHQPTSLQQPELRRRAHIGLNKGELRNSLARALRFYRRGAVADRDREEQQRKASGLNLVLAAISLWNTVYLQKAIQALADAANPVPEEVIPHLSPLGWEHITLTGSYHWRKFPSNFNKLRACVHSRLPASKTRSRHWLSVSPATSPRRRAARPGP